MITTLSTFMHKLIINAAQPSFINHRGLCILHPYAKRLLTPDFPLTNESNFGVIDRDI